MTVTAEQVETALITWFNNDMNWSNGMAPWSADKFRAEMRATLEAALSASPAGAVKPLQSRVQPWMMACFGPEISADKLERSDRFIEEALELVQSDDYPKERVLALVDYVYGREKGEMPQEVGGVMITLAAFCLAHDIDMHEAGETELARIWTKVEKIRAKHAAKPTGSALPVAARIMSAIEPAGVGVETARTEQMSDLERKIFEILTHGFPAPFARVRDLSRRIAALKGDEQ